ncbi:unnamed protein product [Prorocentrum cordatum]|uniref:Apple domain-containing protein n=1 Tax=Prorocentrum cordatum TaxID=2364126 RepID=A0ABN9S0V7_9DINO|nr:unnamed protein product [Polarella glacialis]
MAFGSSLRLLLLPIPLSLGFNRTATKRQLRGLLSETIYCNPYLQQMCPPGDVACPQCGSDRCECPGSPGPSPSPDTKCSWEEHRNSDGNNLLQAPWSQDPQACCNHCGEQSGCAAWTFIQGSHECWLKSWVPSRDQWRWDDSAISGQIGAPSLQAALDAPSNSSLQGLLSETIYCNPYLQQMCPPGDVACPQCGSDRCECPGSPGPSPSPDTKCSWEEHRNSDGNNLLQAPWSQDPQACCNHCGEQSGCAAWTFIQGSHECWLKSWVPSRDQWRWDDSAISGQIGAPSLQAALDAPSNSSLQGLLSETIYCNPYLQQMCPPGDVACPQCGSDRCECPGSPGPSPSPDTKCSWEEHRNSGLLSETIYCNPYLQQMCPPGDVACPQCGSDRCECPSSPSPSPSPDTKCSWEEHSEQRRQQFAASSLVPGPAGVLQPLRRAVGVRGVDLHSGQPRVLVEELGAV